MLMRKPGDGRRPPGKHASRAATHRMHFLVVNFRISATDAAPRTFKTVLKTGLCALSIRLPPSMNGSDPHHQA